MGQYFLAVILDKDRNSIIDHMRASMYGEGAKILEHGFISNKFMLAVEYYISKTPVNILWAGDYATPDSKNSDVNIYHSCTDASLIFPLVPNTTVGKYIINHSKKEFITITSSKDTDIHPLPLLVCEYGNNVQDVYRGYDEYKIIGRWARDLIGIGNIKPNIKYIQELHLTITEDEILFTKNINKINSEKFIKELIKEIKT